MTKQGAKALATGKAVPLTTLGKDAMNLPGSVNPTIKEKAADKYLEIVDGKSSKAK